MYQDALLNLNLLLIKFLHMFVLPDVPSACIVGVELVHGLVSVTNFSGGLTETLKTI